MLKSKSGSLSNLEHLVTNFPDEWANFEQRMEYKQGSLLYDFLEDEALPLSAPSSPSSRMSEAPIIAPTHSSYASPSFFRFSIPKLSLSDPEEQPRRLSIQSDSKGEIHQRFRGKDAKKLLLEIRLWASYPHYCFFQYKTF